LWYFLSGCSIFIYRLLDGVFIFCHRTDVRTNDALVLAYPKGGGQPKSLYPKSKELGFTGFFYKFGVQYFGENFKSEEKVKPVYGSVRNYQP